MSHPAPIAIFCYNRPSHLSRCLAALAANELAPRSPLYIFCDGPKDAGDSEAVEQTRKVAREARGFLKVHVRASEANKGLARSVGEGITEVCGRHGRIIVVEDDLEVSPGFLAYMNEGLDRYENRPEVMQISANMFPVQFEGPARGFFMRMVTTWGWATWERAWQKFSNDPATIDLSRLDAEAESQFDLGGRYPYAKMLRNRLAGKNNSWGVMWWWAVFWAGGLTLHPTRSFVRNFGFDGSGTHFSTDSNAENFFAVETYAGEILWPEGIAVDEEASDKVADYMQSTCVKKPKKPGAPKQEKKTKPQKPGFFRKLWNSVGKRLGMRPS